MGASLYLAAGVVVFPAEGGLVVDAGAPAAPVVGIVRVAAKGSKEQSDY
jgi:hypothetical protein